MTFKFKQNLGLVLMVVLLSSVQLLAQTESSVQSSIQEEVEAPMLLPIQPKIQVSIGLWIPKGDEMGGQADFSYFLTKKMGLTASYGYIHHGNQNSLFYNGIYSQDVYSYKEEVRPIKYPGIVLSSTGWQNSGETVSFPEFSGNFALNTQMIRLGFSFENKRTNSPWCLQLRPTLIAYQHTFISFETENTLIDYFTNTAAAGRQGFYDVQIERTETHHRQTRKMEEKADWIFGLGYEIGVRRLYRKHFFLGARVMGTLTGARPYKDGLVGFMEPYSYQAVLEAGTWF